MSILLKHLPYREYPRHPVHYIHQASTSYQDIFDVDPALNGCIFEDLMSNNASTYNVNEEDFEPEIVMVVSHITSNKQSGVNIWMTSLVG